MYLLSMFFCKKLPPFLYPGGGTKKRCWICPQNVDQCSRKKKAFCQGCQIFIGPKYQNGEKYTKLSQNIPNGYKIFQMAVN
jgi:hypothetical protein